MGYNLTIGNAVLCKDDGYLRIDVVDVMLEEAPVNSSDDQSNSCSLSYSTWGEFAKKAGLHDVFFNGDDGLIAHHPGTVLLEQKHLDAFKAAKLPKTADEWDRRRLAWLIFWSEWALANCEFPAFDNT